MKEKLTLLRHQKTPIERLASQCQNQKGMMLFHEMGTGKTITALSFAKNFPTYKKVVIIPKEIKYVWEENIDKLGIDKKSVKFYFYENLLDLKKSELPTLNRSVLILDESHHVVEILKNKEKRLDLYNWLSSAKKILCLTGTPIYDNFSDIRTQINLCSGKQILPINEEIFKNKYYTNFYFDNAIFGYVLPLFKYPLTIILCVLNHIILTIFTLTKSIDSGGYVEFLSMGQKSLSDFISGGETLSTFIGVFTWPVFALLLVYVIAKYYYKKIEKLKFLDYDKLLDDIEPYVSFFQFKEKNSDISKFFPEVENTQVDVDYNDKQILFWIKMSYGQLTPEELNRIEIGKTLKDSEIFGEVVDEDQFLDKGRCIGNLFFINGKSKIYPDKFIHVLSKITSSEYEKIAKYYNNYANMVYRGEDEKEISSYTGKISKILNKKVESSVVYSNFYNSGIDLISQFLDVFKIKHQILNPDQTLKEKSKILEKFKSRKNNILLLHPDFTEGISISGARQMHILEPLFKFSKLEQLKARVVRYKSHFHLKESERNVKIYQYVSTCSSFTKQIGKLFNKLEGWYKFESQTNYFERKKKFNQDTTVDSIVINRVDTVKKEAEKLKKRLEKQSRREKVLEENCQIWLPGEDYKDYQNSCELYYDNQN